VAVLMIENWKFFGAWKLGFGISVALLRCFIACRYGEC
jgi:hypothetical protein